MPSGTRHAPDNLSLEAAARRPAITFRAVLAGFAGVCLIAAVGPYNDLLLENTFLIGGNMPLGMLVLMLLLLVFVNGPLSRWAPRYAFSAGELTVILSMMLVSCAVPLVGFTSYIIGMLEGIKHNAGSSFEVATLLSNLHLPEWVFPAVHGQTPAQQATDPVIRDLVGRIPPGSAYGIPWSAWLWPLVSWTIWGLAMWGACMCVSLIVRRQWVENERLMFPIAMVYSSLLESPKPRRWFNDLLGNKVFWLGVAFVVGLRGWNGLATYFPKYWPEIPLDFNVSGLMRNPPFLYIDSWVKRSHVYFAVIGISFFLQTRIAFSIWFFYMIYNVALMVAGSYQMEIKETTITDQLCGSAVMWGLLILWVGRGHYLMVLRQMFRWEKGREMGSGIFGAKHPQGPFRPKIPDPFLPYRMAGWGLMFCLVVMVGWLYAAGTTFIGALAVVIMLMGLLVLVTRIAAETGLYYDQINVPLYRIWTYALPARTTGESFFWSSFMGAAFAHDTRECAPVYMTHALKTADTAGVATGSRRFEGPAFVGLLMASMVVALLVSAVSTLQMDYHHATALSSQTVINPYAVQDMAGPMVLSPTRQYMTGITSGSGWLGNFTFGAAITAILGVLRLRLEEWPLHPIGFLLSYTAPVTHMWFNIFLGWLIKALVVKFGGATLFRRSQPLFIGLIIGEAVAAAIFLSTALVLAGLGEPYKRIYFTP